MASEPAFISDSITVDPKARVVDLEDSGTDFLIEESAAPVGMLRGGVFVF